MSPQVQLALALSAFTTLLLLVALEVAAGSRPSRISRVITWRAERILRRLPRQWGIRCWIRDMHWPIRVPLGWRCLDCGAPLADFDDAGLGSGFVGPIRRLYSRETGTVTRTVSYEPTTRGW